MTGSRLFDARYYLAHFSNSSDAWDDPAAHFFNVGWRRGIDPHPLFDVRYYLRQCPQLEGGSEDPLTHFMRIGASQGLRPHPLFDTAYYARRYVNDVQDENPLVYFLEQGAAQHHDPNPFFETAYYLASSPDVAAAGVNPLAHYVTSGFAEGRRANALFDGRFYSKRKSLGEDEDPLSHFVRRLEEARTRFKAPTGAPEVSVVVLSYRKIILTLQCVLDVLADSSGEGRVEVVVVDNGSPPEEFALLASQLPPIVRLVRLEVNRFFGEGNNIGAEAAAGRLVLFLNNDAFVTEGAIGALLGAFGRSDCGAAGPRFLYPDGRIQEAGAMVGPDGTVVQRGKNLENTAGRFAEVEAVQYVSAACLMVARDTFDAIGGFDLTWEPAYYEDVDLCLKVATTGKQVYYCPDAVVFHIENATSTEAAFKLRLDNIVEINREKFIDRWGAYLDGSGAERNGLVEMSPERARKKADKSAVLYTPYELVPGGGERYLLTFAGSLTGSHAVVLSTEERYSRLRLRTMGRELGLDVSGIGYVPAKELTSQLSADVFVVMENHLLPPLPGIAHRNVYICQFPFPMDADYLSDCWSYLKSYDLVVVYSEFVSRHLKGQAGLYGMTLPEVVILPPPVRQMGLPAGTRSGPPRILNVGRFYPGGHCKRQDNLIEAFKKLRARMPDVELHLAGVLPPDPIARDFFVHLRHLAKGQPIFFHLNASLDQLRNMYNEASVYWHATGLGVSVDLFPERFEHFGITILEAMSAGAIPFVLGEGGPPGFVVDGSNGYLWHSEAELVDATCTFLDLDSVALGRIREQARRTASEYDEARFRERVRVTVGA